MVVEMNKELTFKPQINKISELIDWNLMQADQTIIYKDANIKPIQNQEIYGHC